MRCMSFREQVLCDEYLCLTLRVEETNVLRQPGVFSENRFFCKYVCVYCMIMCIHYIYIHICNRNRVTHVDENRFYCRYAWAHSMNLCALNIYVHTCDRARVICGWEQVLLQVLICVLRGYMYTCVCIVCMYASYICTHLQLNPGRTCGWEQENRFCGK